MKAESDKIKLFYCYSHKDEELRNQLETHLTLLKRKGIIDAWHDRMIVPGQTWDQEIKSELEEADIILFLVSSDFLASDYCYDVEVKRAIELYDQNKNILIPIILRECDWEGAPFDKIQGLPTDMKPVVSRHWHNIDEAFNNITQGLKKAVNQIKNKRKKEALEIELKREQNSPINFDEIFSLLSIPTFDDLESVKKGRRLYNSLSISNKKLFCEFLFNQTAEREIIEQVLKVFEEISISIPEKSKFKLTQYLIGLHSNKNESIRRKAANMLRFINKTNQKDQPALSLYDLLFDNSPSVINRALVSLEYNCRNISNRLWNDILHKVDNLYKTGEMEIIDGVLFFYGNVKTEKLKEELIIDFLDKILSNVNHPNSEIRRRAIWSLASISERIPISKHQEVLDFIIELSEVDRSISIETVAKIATNLRGKLTPKLQKDIDNYMKSERRKIEKYEELRMKAEFNKGGQ